MIGKTHASPATPFALPGYSVLELSGRDAGAFLHAQAMNEVRSLDDGRWQWNGVLSAKGRVLALFALLRLAPERWWAILPDVPAGDFEAHLLRYRFRAKVSFTVRTDLQACGLMRRSGDAKGPVAALAADGTVLLDLSGDSERTLLLGPGTGTADPDSAADWLREDLRHGLPRLPAAQHDAWTPQMLSLERLHAFSVSKGCYPGQEIVARTHFLGQAKRQLALLALSQPAAPGTAVLQGGQSQGELVSTAPAGDDGQLALAVLAATAGEALEVEAHAARRLPFAAGLAR
jgi:hypothetical protein